MNAPPSDSASDRSASIEIDVNGELRRLTPGASVADLLEILALGGKRVAVAVNRRVVPRPQHAEAILVDRDRVEILEAVGGG